MDCKTVYLLRTNSKRVHYRMISTFFNRLVTLFNSRKPSKIKNKSVILQRLRVRNMFFRFLKTGKQKERQRKHTNKF